MNWRSGIERFFYPVMALIIAGVVFYGFSFTVAGNLIHPPYPRPLILYVHAIVFGAWIPLFIFQTLLVSSHNVKLHRLIGRWGVAHGALLPVVGILTAIAMTTLRVRHGELDEAPSFLIPLFDSIAFTIAFSLAVIWRTKPEYHRRLMYVATCILTAAAFGRFPGVEKEWFYVGVDALVTLGLLRDFAVNRKIHAVYCYALPCLIAGQCLTAYLRWLPQWLNYSVELFH